MGMPLAGECRLLIPRSAHSFSGWMNRIFRPCKSNAGGEVGIFLWTPCSHAINRKIAAQAAGCKVQSSSFERTPRAEVSYGQSNIHKSRPPN